MCNRCAESGRQCGPLIFSRDSSEKRLAHDFEDLKRLLCITNVAFTFWHHGYLEEAEKAQSEVVDIEVKTFGEDHPHTMNSKANLACLYWEQGRFEEAERLEVSLLKMMSRMSKTLKAKHPHIHKCRDNLACTYIEQGHLEKAMRMVGSATELETLRKCILHDESEEIKSIHDWQAIISRLEKKQIAMSGWPQRLLILRKAGAHLAKPAFPSQTARKLLIYKMWQQELGQRPPLALWCLDSKVKFLWHHHPSRIDQIKQCIEDFSGSEGDWWPLDRPMKKLEEGMVRLKWKCVSANACSPRPRVEPIAPFLDAFSASYSYSCISTDSGRLVIIRNG